MWSWWASHRFCPSMLSASQSRQGKFLAGKPLDPITGGRRADRIWSQDSPALESSSQIWDIDRYELGAFQSADPPIAAPELMQTSCFKWQKIRSLRRPSSRFGVLSGNFHPKFKIKIVENSIQFLSWDLGETLRMHSWIWSAMLGTHIVTFDENKYWWVLRNDSCQSSI